MKQKFPILLQLASFLLLAWCLLRIGSLQEQIETLQSNQSSQFSNLQGQISGISGQVERSLEEGASLLASFETEYGQMDVSSGQVTLTCSLVPKVMTPDTAAQLICNGQPCQMERQGDGFVLKLPIDLYQETIVEKAVLLRQDKTETQKLDEYFSPRIDYLPSLYANWSGTGRRRTAGNTSYDWDGTVDLSASCPTECSFSEPVLLVYIDGALAERLTLEWEEDAAQKLAEGNTITAPLIGEWELSPGQTLDFYLEVKDQHNLLYRCQLEHMVLDANGEPSSEDMSWWGMEASIYSEQGKLLYSPF